MKQETPMQEFIRRLKEYNECCLNDCGTGVDVFVILLAEKVQEKEKEVMCKFQSDGQRTDFWVKYSDNEDCFDKTFNNEER